MMKRRYFVGIAVVAIGAIASTSCQNDYSKYSTRRSKPSADAVAREGTKPDGFEPTPSPFALRLPGQRIAAGSFHTCGISAGGALKCWGRNDSGQLGTNDVAGKLSPTAVTGMGTGVVGVSAGHHHTCAVLQSGKARCWGSNTFGQLGDGSQVDKLVPQDVSGITTSVVSVEAGAYHSCALDTEGTVFCWGSNRDGQLGMGDNIDASAPAKVPGLPGPIGQISVGRFHTCALTRDGKAYCWGRNTQGQLGLGDLSAESSPIAVPSAGRIVSVAAGFVHTCVLAEDGSVACFGDNTCGQLGNGANDSSPTPVVMPDTASSPVLGLTVGGSHTCFVKADGSMSCAGCNPKGTLGTGTIKDSNVPVKVDALLETESTLAGGDLHSCALRGKDGKIWCWGGNNNGQLGNGTQKDQSKPVLLGL